MSDTISNIGKNHLIIFFIRTGDNVVVSVSYCLHNTIFFGFDHDANIEVILDITARKQDRVISKNPDRLICIYIIIYQEVTFTTNRVSFYNLILYLLKNNVFSLSLYPFAFTPFTSLVPFFTILAFPLSYIQANDDAGH